jgi:para-nitrobenzyl esterase
MKSSILHVLVPALPCVLIATSALAAPIKVATDSGVLIGKNDGAINTFKGVPYAKPPVGDLRWRAPDDHWYEQR